MSHYFQLYLKKSVETSLHSNGWVAIVNGKAFPGVYESQTAVVEAINLNLKQQVLEWQQEAGVDRLITMEQLKELKRKKDFWRDAEIDTWQWRIVGVFVAGCILSTLLLTYLVFTGQIDRQYRDRSPVIVPKVSVPIP